ncbi:uncharacterized protein LOC124494736 [Dermatophagoides farinae]|uniref:uncharacterized protein LOC124494736 n=1 Tax=Dermatophagoides farinae TaxID=6954 RepID=UPI003F63A40D
MAFIFNALAIHNNLEQLLETIKRCAVTNLVVISNRDRSILNEQRLYHLREQFKSHFSVWFGEKDRQQQSIHGSMNGNIRYCMLDICLPKDFGRSNLDNSRIDQFNREHETRKKETHVIVAKFKATTISKIYMIDDYAIFSQLIYATLPGCGFEWNMNDIILSMNGMFSWVSVLELLIVMSVGAQIIINTTHIRDSCICLDQMVKLVNQYNVSTCLMDSYSLESSGFGAIQLMNRQGSLSYMNSWPLVQVKLIDWHSNETIASDDQYGRPGHLYIRCPFASRIVWQQPQQLSDESYSQEFDWILTDFIGFYDSEGHLQIIDRSDNFIMIHGKRFSKTLIETIIMAMPSVRRTTVQPIEAGSILPILVTLIPDAQCSQEEIQKQLECHLGENAIEFRFEIIKEE